MPKIFITANLTLPTPPEGHRWYVRNVVKVRNKKTTYMVKISLLDGQENALVVHHAKWDRERELLNDFLAVVVDEVTRKLDDYLNFMSVDWSVNNTFSVNSEFTVDGSYDETDIENTWE